MTVVGFPLKETFFYHSTSENVYFLKYNDIDNKKQQRFSNAYYVPLHHIITIMITILSSKSYLFKVCSIEVHCGSVFSNDSFSNKLLFLFVDEENTTYLATNVRNKFHQSGVVQGRIVTWDLPGNKIAARSAKNFFVPGSA